MLLVSCKQRKNYLPEYVKCRCILSPTGTIHDTYLIELTDRGIINTSFGSLSDTVRKMISQDATFAQYDKTLVENIEKEGSTKIANEDYQNLIYLLKQSQKLQCDNPFVVDWPWDAWIVILITESNQFVTILHEESNETIKQIVNGLIKLSPIPFSEDTLVGGREKISPDSVSNLETIF